MAAGVDLFDSATGSPLPDHLDAAARVRAEAHRRGVMTRLFDGDMFGFAPPFVITESEIDEMVDIFGSAVRAVRENNDRPQPPNEGS